MNNIRKILSDPYYLDLHLAAVSAINQIGEALWYDGHFIRRYEVAKRYLEEVRPDVVGDFVSGFSRLHPGPNFKTLEIRSVFEAAIHSKIAEIVSSLDEKDLETHENAKFGRDLVWDHPFFVDLQLKLAPTVSEMVGDKLTPSYNFLSLYRENGKCEPHMDEPCSMYTLDYCIDQSDLWPISFSDIIDWQSLGDQGSIAQSRKTRLSNLSYSSYVLEPNDALLFCGSSQMHYRDTIPNRGFCDLLFFHYYPEGCEELVRPKLWHRFFGISELKPLCDLFSDSPEDGLSS